MSAFVAITGKIIIVGKSPDGDSLRFVPNNPAHLSRLAFSYRLRVSPDGSSQLRFEAIDTPETHYEYLAQPLGDAARDALLRLAGFSHVTFNKETVLSATPLSVPATIVSRMVEVNGRPVAYVFLGVDPGLSDGLPVVQLEPFLPRSLNAAMLANGMAYPTFYTSTLAPHRELLGAIAHGARTHKLGVWGGDKTAQFTLVTQSSIGPAGELILPKLFRRCTDYLKMRQKGFTGTLAEWLVSTHGKGTQDQDDEVWVGGKKVRLSSLLMQQGSTLGLLADVAQIVFVEK